MLTLYTSDRDLAAELAQEALARACRHWRRVQHMDAPGAWLYRVALNLANSAGARRRADRRARADAVVLTDFSAIPSQSSRDRTNNRTGARA
jgi:DNA-directed RNA polymerase specialized sigma24 family protein